MSGTPEPARDAAPGNILEADRTGLDRSSGRTVLADLVASVDSQLPRLVAAHVDSVMSSIEPYQAGEVPRADLRRSVEDNMRFMVDALRDPDAPRDFSAPRETARRRARQGVPLPEVLRAFRMGFLVLWNELSAHIPATADPDIVPVVLAAARTVWELTDDYAIALTESYRETTAELLMIQQQRRSALVEALFTAAAGSEAGPWEVSRLLGFPPDADLLVVAADTRRTAEEGLPGIEARLARRGIASAWRLAPSMQMGLVAMQPDQLDTVLGVVRDSATSRTGLSPVFRKLRDTPRALHLAQAALATLEPGTAGVTRFRTNPLAGLVALDPDEADRLCADVLGPVLDLPAEDSAPLLDTLRAWFDNAGSAERTGEQLFCHPNTVRYRLRRVQELTGRSVTEPYGVADLAAALEAYRLRSGH